MIDTNTPPLTPPQVAERGNQAPEPVKQPDFLSSKKGLLVAGVALLLVLSLLWVTFKSLKGNPLKQESPGTAQTGQQSVSKEPALPPSLPPVTEDKYKPQAKTLGEYFKQASPANFKESYLSGIPAVASTAYDQYRAAKDDKAKLESARNFYDYLNSSSLKSDAQFIKFLGDVKGNLEKTLGRKL